MTGGTNAQYTTSYDSGTTSVILNGTTYSTNWGQGSTASSIATVLAASLNGTLVSATANGGVISIVANAQGASTNYTLSVSSSSTLGSFTAAASGSALSGGADAVAAVPMHTVWSGLAVTLYKYDALGNLYCVKQHGDAATGTACPATPPGPADAPVQPDPNNAWRRRLFAYDSLSRLRWASNPESGVITYSYDADGNLLQKTSPAPNQTGTATQIVSYCYDALHRVTGKGYGAQTCPLATPVVTYSYDSGTNAIGHLTSLTDQAGSGSYTYDSMGRPATETRPIAGVSKSTSYTYNLDGSVKTLTYPSGRVVTYTPNSADRLISAVDGNRTNYVTSANYNPDGSLKGLVNGSTPALTSSFQYTHRLQLCRMTTITAGTMPTSCGDTNTGNVMDRGYNFNDGAGDNGNVMAIINYRDASRSQSFTYDPLNRLASGWSSANTGAYSWGENYSIDAWGNLQISPLGGKAHGGTFQLSGNAQNRPTGMNYDAAGNLLSYLTANYTYDQENRLLSTAGMSYTYDGNGERVLKSQVINNVLTPVKRYWSMGGNTLADDDGSGNLTAEYVYFGGKRVARIDLPANTVHYYLSDHLGSTSIVVSSSGIREEESDYSPFGTEYVITGAGVNRYKFTGKERDSETGLDNFGARYDSSNIGRFMTPDPLGGEKIDPQTLNKYSYVRNNSVNLIDPTGLYTCADQADCKSKRDIDFEKARQHDLKSKDPNVVRAANAYGDPTKDNHVNVGFSADLDKKGEGGDTKSTLGADEKGNMYAVSNVTISSKLSGSDLDATVGHEGSHVADAQDVAQSISITSTAPYFKVGMDISRYASEQRAYAVSDSILRSDNTSQQFACGLSPCVLGKGLTMSSQLPETIDRILQNSPLYRSNGQPLSPTNQGGSVVLPH